MSRKSAWSYIWAVLRRGPSDFPKIASLKNRRELYSLLCQILRRAFLAIDPRERAADIGVMASMPLIAFRIEPLVVATSSTMSKNR